MEPPAALTVYGTAWCPDCRRVKRFLDERHIAYVELDIEQDRRARNRMKRYTHGQQIFPTLVFPDGSVFINPSNAALAAKLGVSTLVAAPHPYDGTQ